MVSGWCRDLADSSGRCGTSLVAAALGFALAVVAACGSPPPPPSSGGGQRAGNAATATSAQDFGGMEGLVAAAKKEGELNVIALPPDWANYGTMIKTFEQKYGIKVNSAQPDADSQDEINAAKQLKGQSRAPDVFDLGVNVALSNTDLFAPYRVVEWAQIRADLKDPSAKWYSDYTGFMSIGYDAGKVPPPTSVDDLLKPAYKGKVALNGNPTRALAGFAGVMMAAIAHGGSLTDIAPGVTFFHNLKVAGNFLPVDPTPATIASGQTPVVIDWDYNNVAQTQALKGKMDWRVFVPNNAVVGAYYVQAVNVDAPHPAAARLWEEFLYSDQGQNIWLQGFARPVLLSQLEKSGKADKTALAQLPQVSRTVVNLDPSKIDKAKQYVAEHWQEAVG